MRVLVLGATGATGRHLVDQALAQGHHVTAPEPVYRSGEDIEAASMIPRVSRADLAEFMLSQLTNDTYVRRTPAVMY